MALALIYTEGCKGAGAQDRTEMRKFHTQSSFHGEVTLKLHN